MIPLYYSSGYVIKLRLRCSGFAKAKTSYGSGCGSATLVGSFLSDGFIKGMTSTSMEFDIAISFLFVNSFKLSYKMYRYLFILSRMVLELHARPRSKVKFIKHVELNLT